jgi:hypothetical protein
MLLRHIFSHLCMLACYNITFNWGKKRETYHSYVKYNTEFDPRNKTHSLNQINRCNYSWDPSISITLELIDPIATYFAYYFAIFQNGKYVFPINFEKVICGKSIQINGLQSFAGAAGLVGPEGRHWLVTEALLLKKWGVVTNLFYSSVRVL